MSLHDATTRRMPKRERFVSMSMVKPETMPFEAIEAKCYAKIREQMMRGIEAALEGKPRPVDRNGAMGWDACLEAVRLGRIRKGKP